MEATKNFSDFGQSLINTNDVISTLENNAKEATSSSKRKKEPKAKEDTALQILQSTKRSKRVQLVLYPFLFEQAKEIANKKHISFNKLVELLLFDAVQKEKS